MFGFGVDYDTCHSHTSLKKEKEREVTVFWFDLGLKLEEKFLGEDVKKVEKSSAFKFNLRQ